mmetsp:Transcript_3202/g.8494  ORF Transcript_3202/g.8494 Transcript_3202/m.8494 type:complete len:211 (+) Transcript_3202:351-983(+)
MRARLPFFSDLLRSLLHGFPAPQLLDRSLEFVLRCRGNSSRRRLDKVDLLLEFLPGELPLLPLPFLEPVGDEPRLPLVPDLRDLLHGLERLLHDLAVVPLRPVPLPLQLKGRVVRQILSLGCSVRLRPLHLARVALHLEVVVALGPAEPEHRAIVSGEHDPPSGVDVRGAKPARFQPHGERCAVTRVAASLSSLPRDKKMQTQLTSLLGK